MAPAPDLNRLRELARASLADADTAALKGDFVHARDHMVVAHEAIRRVRDQQQLLVEAEA